MHSKLYPRAAKVSLAAIGLLTLVVGSIRLVEAQQPTTSQEHVGESVNAELVSRFGLAGDDLGYADEVILHVPGVKGSGDGGWALRPTEEGGLLDLGHGGQITVLFDDNWLSNSGDARPDLVLIGEQPSVAVALRPADELTAQLLRRSGWLFDVEGFASFGRCEGRFSAVDIDAFVPGWWRGDLRFDAVRINDLTVQPSTLLVAAPPQQLLLSATIGGILALTTDLNPVDIVSRELSLQVLTPQDDFRPVDIASREMSVQVLTPEDDFRPVDVVSREMSIQVMTAKDDFRPTSIVSREMSLQVLAPEDEFRPFDVVSREMSVQVFAPEDQFRPFDVVSREMSVRVYDPNVDNGPFDIISREMSIRVLGGADLRVVSVEGPGNGLTDEQLTFTWFTRNAGNSPTVSSWTERLAFSTDGTNAGIVAYHDVTVAGGLTAGSNRSQSLMVPSPSTPGTYFVLVSTDVTDVVVEDFQQGAETNNLLVSATRLVVEQAPRPSLQIIALTPPRSTTPADAVEIVWWTRNVGNAATNSSWTETITLGSGSALGNPQLLHTVQVTGPLAPGEQRMQVVQLAWPATMPSDPWLTVCANAGSELILLPTATPCASVQVCTTCERPDLVPTAVVTPATAIAGESISVAWTVTNHGSGEAVAPWVERVELVREADGTVVAGATVNQRASLAAGALRNSTVSILVPPDLEGLFRVVVTVDAANQLLEPSGETNNTAQAATPTLVSQPPRPNLTIASAQLSSNTATSNGSIDVLWLATNLGDAPAVAPWQDAVYLTMQPSFDLGSAQLKATYTHLADLASGASYPAGVSRTISMPGNPGTYWVHVSTDRLGDVEEGTGETGNTVQVGMVEVSQPPRPNLLITSIVPPTSGPAGSVVSVSWTVANNGLIGLNAGSGSQQGAQWNERIYASSDSVFGGDLLLATSPYNDSLPPGAAVARSTLVPVPPLTGGYYLIVQLDPTNAVLESNENDNVGVASSAASVELPNLVASAVVAPLTAVADGTVTISWMVNNTSTSATVGGGWLDTVYLRPVGSASAQPLGSVARNAALAPGANYTASLNATLPGYAIGSYEVVVQADAVNGVAESTDADNTAVGAAIQISQPPRPNLIVESVTVPAHNLVSRVFTAQWRLRNTGSAPTTGTFTDGIYAVDVASGSEQMVGFATISTNLAPDEFIDVTAQASMPAQVGSYRLAVVTDRANAINEGPNGGENDNRGVSSGPFFAETFNVTASTSVVAEPTPASVAIVGMATTSVRGAQAANVPVDVAVDLRGVRRILRATTGLDGSFALEFRPLPNEAGRYELRSGPRNHVASGLNDSFELYALTAEPVQRDLAVYPGFRPTSTSFTVRNQGDTSLTGLQVSTPNLPPGVTLTHTFSEAQITALGSVGLDLTLQAATSTATQELPLDVMVLSAQGAVASIRMNLSIHPPEATIIASEPVLRANIQVPPPGSPGLQNLFEFQLTNSGAGISQPITVLTPVVAWMRLATPMPLAPLLPGESTTIALLLDPRHDQLAPGATLSGTISVLGGATTTQLPFEFKGAKNGNGDLTIRTSNEGTYWRADGQALAGTGPRVGGAVITIREYFNPSVVHTVTTGADGIAAFTDLQPGYYSVRCEAPNHIINQTSLLVRAGDEQQYEAFLPAQQFHYTWNVSPTQIEDQYTISVNTTFNVFVPAPIITIDPPLMDLDTLAATAAGTGGSFQVDYTVTNHGLIAANEVLITIEPPSNFVASTPTIQLGSIAPSSSVVIPVVYTRMVSTLQSRSASSSSTCYGQIRLDWSLVCGLAVPYFTSSQLRDGLACTPPTSVEIGVSPTTSGGATATGSTTTYTTPPAPTVYVNCRTGVNCVLAIIDIIPNPYVQLFGLALQAGQIVFTQMSGETPSVKQVYKAAIRGVKITGVDPATVEPLSALDKRVPSKIRSFCKVIRDCLGLVPPGTPCSPSDLVFAAINQIAQYASSSSASIANTSNGWHGFLGSSPDPIVQNWLLQSERVAAVQALIWYPFGDVAWLEIADEDGDTARLWHVDLMAAMEDTSDDGVRISAAEHQQLLLNNRPASLEMVTISKFVARWNRTDQYWSNGILTINDLPPGFNDDFIDFDVVSRLYAAVWSSIEDVNQEGSAGIFEAYDDSASLLAQYLSTPEQGVCATVEMQVDQTATLTRSAFRASLGLANDTSEVLQAIDVDIEIEGIDGQPANHLFAIQIESLSGIGSLDGGSSMLPSSNASAAWLLVPSSAAAPVERIPYVVKGGMSFVRNGVFVYMPFAPTTIDVLPNADLKFMYFIERDVYADDPFTNNVVEPSVPFDLGLRVENEGAGSVSNMSIVSAQPRIVRNDSDLLIDFQIVGSQVGTQPGTPSLAVNLGSFGPASTNTARWQLTSSLQGRFIGYEASIRNLNGLDDPEFWVIDPLVDVRPMLRSVRLDEGGDDLLSDFLEVDYNVDPAHPLEFLPTAVWLSDGTERPVHVIQNAGVVTQGGTVPRAVVTASIDSARPNYIRLPDPFNGQHVLTGVQRSDGKVLQLGPNVWQTQRELTNGPSILRPRVHIFDEGGDGTYILTYTVDITGPTAVGWGSRSQYGPSSAPFGNYDLRLFDDGSSVDPRFGGPEVLRVAFSEPVDSTTFTPANVRLFVNTGRRVGHIATPVATTISSDGRIGSIVLLAPIPDKSHVCVTLSGVRDLAGNLLAKGSERLTFSVLIGDVSGDGRVNQEDVTAIGALVGTNPIDPGNTQHLRADIDRNGAIDTVDAAAVQARMGGSMTGVSRACVEPTTPGGG